MIDLLVCGSGPLSALLLERVSWRLGARGERRQKRRRQDKAKQKCRESFRAQGRNKIDHLEPPVQRAGI